MSGPDAGAFIVLVIVAGGVVLTWVNVHYKNLKTVKPTDIAAIENRLARIEQAVDAITVETERISEGQRFTTKLLSERTPARGPS